jgi:hypothetical protein
MTVRDTGTLATPSGSSPIAGAGFPLGTILYAHYGQPARLCTYTKMATVASEYQLWFPNGGFNSSTILWYIMKSALPGGDVFASTNQWPCVGGYAIGTSSSFHGPTIPYGSSTNGNYIFCNAGDQFELKFYGGTMTGVANFTLVEYVSPTSPPLPVQEYAMQIPTAATPSGQFTWTIASPGHYALRCDELQTTTGGIPNTGAYASVVLRIPTGTAPKWCNKTLGDVDPGNSGDLNVVECARVNASSFLISNTTSVMTKQGTVIAARVRDHFPYAMSETLLGKLAEKYNDLAEKGVYSFKEFSEVEERFANVADDGYLNYDLDYDGYYHFVSISNPNYATAPNSFTLSIDTTLEFRTDIARYNKGVSMLSHHDLIEARRIINSNPAWFYENPLHMADIYRFMQRGANLAKRYGPMALDAAAILDPSRGALYRNARSLLF